MKLKYCLPAMLLLLLQCRLPAQTNQIKPLTLESAVPDVAMQMVNYKKSSATLSEFKDKLLILDFWSPKCTACVHEIAALDNLQQQFNSSLFILPVSASRTGENIADVKRFIKGYKQRLKGGFLLPVIVEDSVFSTLFPFETLSECIWIYKGKYIAHTDGTEVTAENIASIINNQPVHLSQINRRTFYDGEKSLSDYVRDTFHVQQFSHHLFKGEITSLEPATGYVRDTANGNKIVAINCNVLALYELAYNVPAPFYKNRVINKVKNNNLFAAIEKADNDSSNNLYSYEYKSDVSYDVLRSQMQKDLQSCFNVTGEVKKENVNCLVLQSIKSDTIISDDIAYSDKIEGNTLYEDIKGERVLYNQPISILIERLNELLPVPVIDETGITKNVNLHLPNNLMDINALSKALQQQGFLLQAQNHPVEMFVLMDAADQ